MSDTSNSPKSDWGWQSLENIVPDSTPENKISQVSFNDELKEDDEKKTDISHYFNDDLEFVLENDTNISHSSSETNDLSSNNEVNYFHPKNISPFDEDLDFVCTRNLEENSSSFGLAKLFCPIFIFSEKQKYYEFEVKRKPPSIIVESHKFISNNIIRSNEDIGCTMPVFYTISKNNDYTDIIYCLRSPEFEDDTEFVVVRIKSNEHDYILDSVYFSMCGRGRWIKYNQQIARPEIECIVNLHSAGFYSNNYPDSTSIQFEIKHKYTNKVKHSNLTYVDSIHFDTIKKDYKNTTILSYQVKDKFCPIPWGMKINNPELIFSNTFFESKEPEKIFSSFDFKDRLYSQNPNENNETNEIKSSSEKNNESQIPKSNELVAVAIGQLTDALQKVLTNPKKKMMLFYIDLPE